MIFRVGEEFTQVNRAYYRNDFDYYAKLYNILTNQKNNAKTTPVNKILSAMFIE